MAKRKTAEEKAAPKAAKLAAKAAPVETPVETPIETPVEEAPAAEARVFQVDLFDATDVQHNGQHHRLPKGKQVVSEHIYNVLKDANLV